MAKRTFLAGVTSQTIDIFVQDSSSTIGAGLAALAFNTSGLKAYYRKGATGTVTAITLATQTVGGAWSSGGFVETDATNMKGVYRFDIPDTVLAATPAAILYFYGATNMASVVAELEIVSYNPFDGVRLGLTALPNAAANAAGGLPVSAAGALDLDEMNVDIEAIQTSTAGLTYTVANQVDVNVLDWKSATAPAMTGDAFARLGAPAGASVSADIAQVEANAVTIASYIDTEVAAIKAKTDNLPATPAATGDAMTLTAGERNSVADALLNRDMSTGTDGGSTTVRTVRQALRFLRNKWGISAGTLTVCKEDDATTSWTSSVTTDAAALPIVSNDPAGP